MSIAFATLSHWTTFDHSSTFLLSLLRSGLQCKGLTKVADVASSDACEAECCAEVGCLVWQWCAAGATTCQAATCWTGSSTTDCSTAKDGWSGAGRDAAPPPDGPVDPRDFDADYLLPGFHFVPWPLDWMNDPNGPFYDPVHDKYHLMYQYQVKLKETRRCCRRSRL